MFNPNAIRAARKRIPLTLDEASRRIGIGHPALSRIERGKRSPSANSLAKIIDEIGVDPAELFTPTPSRRTRRG